MLTLDAETFIEHYGVLDAETFIAHYGKKGMHWGKRGTARTQKRIDSLHRISTGTQTGRDRLRTGLLVTKKGATKSLERGATLQNKVNQGKRKTTNVLLTVQGVKIKDLDFHGVKKGDSKNSGNNKGDTGRKVAIGVISAGLLLNAISNSRR